MERDQERLRAWKKAARLKDIEKARAADRARYARDRERILERQKQYRDANPEPNRQRAAAWNAAHKDDPEVKEKRAAYNKRWKIENREKYLEARRRRYRAKEVKDPVAYEKVKADAARRVRERAVKFKEHARRVKAKVGCACGERDPVCLDFHHRDPATKTYSIGRNITRFSSMAVLKEEIEKCDVVCGNCHVKHHAGTRTLSLTRKAQSSARERAKREERWGHAIAHAKRKGCTLCREGDHRCLQFHHVDPAAKRFKIGDYKLMPLRTDLWLEIQKCVVLCVNCHRRVHAGVAQLPDVSLELYWRGRLAA